MSRVLAARYPARPAEPQCERDGLQLPGAGGVNGCNLVFGSCAGDAQGARIFRAGESGSANACASLTHRSKAVSASTHRRLRGSAWDGFRDFARKSASKSTPLMTGIPAAPLEQVRETLLAQVSLQFLSWTKLTMALATGSQHMNVLAPASGAAAAADGAQAAPAVTPQSGSTSYFDRAGIERCRQVHGRIHRCFGRGLHRSNGVCGLSSDRAHMCARLLPTLITSAASLSTLRWCRR